MNKQEANERFDKYLRFYQKFGTALFLPSLAGLFSLTMYAIGGLTFSALVPGYCQLIKTYASIDGWPLVGIGSAYFLGALTLTFFLAKGKTWCLYLQTGLFFADMVCLFFLIGQVPVLELVLAFVWHAAFFAIAVIAIIFGVKAQKLLDELGDWILGK